MGRAESEHVRDVRIREGAELPDIHVSSLSADVCLSVRVYRRITLRKHRASALNRQHRY